MSKPRVPFSFHCIICFEGFDLHDRPPVILPCGHTYVCSPCSKRLDKCMECRTSLFLRPQPGTGQWTSEQPVHQPAKDNDLPSWYRPPPGRERRDQHHHLTPTKAIKPPPPAEPIALPLPKNLVMMALMEAAGMEKAARDGRRARRKVAAAEAAEKARVEREQERQQRQQQVEHGVGGGDHHNHDRSECSPNPPIDVVSIDAAGIESIEKTDESFRKEQEGDDEDDDGEADEDGDDAVANGGPLFGGDDNAIDDDDDDDDHSDMSDSDASSKAYESGDDDSAVRTGMESMFYHTYGTYVVREPAGLMVLPRHPGAVGGGQGNGSSSGGQGSGGGGGGGGGAPPQQPVLVESPLEIKYGQTLQIVEIDGGGVATLARGMGYVVTSGEEQLVKVGAPLDKACQIEGMMRAVAVKRSRYERKISDMDCLHTGLQSELEDTIKAGGADYPPVIGPVPKLPHVAFDNEDDTKENKEQSAASGDRDEDDKRARTSSPPAANVQVGDAALSPDRQLEGLLPRTPVGSASPPFNTTNYSPYTIDNSEIGPFALSSEDDHNVVIGLEEGLQDARQSLRDTQPLVRENSDHIANRFSLDCGFLSGTASYLNPLHTNDDESLVGLSFDSAIERQLDRSSHSNTNSGANTPDRRDIRPSSDRPAAAAVVVPLPSNREGGPYIAESSRSLSIDHRPTTPQYPPSTPERYGGSLSVGAASFDTVDSRVDFRSGLSGHRGLLGARSHADRVRADRSRDIRMMGEHRGIASIRPMRGRVKKKRDQESLVESFRNMSRFMKSTPEPASQTVPEWNR